MTPPRRGLLHRAGRLIDSLEIALGSIMLLTIFVLVLFQAAQRHLPGESLPWTGEISRFALAWLTFTVAGVLISRGGHITLEVVDLLPQPRLVRTVQVFALLIVAATAGAFALEAWDLVQTQGALRSPVLGLSMAWVYVPVLLGLISSTVRALHGAVHIVRHGPARSELADEVAR